MVSSCRRGGMRKKSVEIEVGRDGQTKQHHVCLRGHIAKVTKIRLHPTLNAHRPIFKVSLAAMDHSHHDHGMHTSDSPEARCKMWMLW